MNLHYEVLWTAEVRCSRCGEIAPAVWGLEENRPYVRLRHPAEVRRESLSLPASWQVLDRLPLCPRHRIVVEDVSREVRTVA